MISLLIFVTISITVGDCSGTTEECVVPPAVLDPAPYPEWAHYHWVWLPNSKATQSSMIEYVQEYMKYDIKVGAVDIDSGWSTGYNDFIFNSKYPNPQNMVNFFHNNSIAIILWATSMVDTDSPNFNESYDKGYFIRDVLGKQAIFSWWHGKGGLLDYTNKEAVDWWHSQMDKALKYGIDGWKCDGTDPYILELIIAKGQSGTVTRREYSDYYYTDFYEYTRTKNGNNTLIMSRSVDGYGPIYLDYTPKKFTFAGWVGDADPTFQGLIVDLKKYLQSAWAGYPNFGSDIGGYRTGKGNLGRTKELLIRWAQLGAFSPLMENGGNKEHRPWMFDNQTLEIYRQYVDIHYQLVPYLLTTGSDAYKHGTSSLTPLAAHNNFIEKYIDDFDPETYNYLLGKDILVAPIYTNDTDGHPVEVKFPKDNNWVSWWNSSVIYKGGDTMKFKNVPLEMYLVFCKQGTIIPLRVTEMTPHWGHHQNLIGHLRLLLHSAPMMSVKSPIATEVTESNGHGVVTSYWMPNDSLLHINITAHSTISVVIEVHNTPGPVDHVVMHTTTLQHVHPDMLAKEGTFHHCTNTNSVYIHPLSNVFGTSLTMYFM